MKQSNYIRLATFLSAAIAVTPAFAALREDGGKGPDQETVKESGMLTIGAGVYGLSVDDSGVHEYYETDGRQPRIHGKLGIASMDLGFNMLTGVNYYGPWEGQGDFLDMNGWKSIRIVWEPASVEIALDRKGSVSICAGIRLYADNYTFSRPYTISYGSDDIPMPHKIDTYVKKSKITATYIGIPLRLSFRIYDDMRITGYAAGDIMMKAHTKYKRPKTKGNLYCISPWRLSVGGCITYRDIGVYCEYSTSPLFEAGTGSDARTISIGLRFGM